MKLGVQYVRTYVPTPHLAYGVCNIDFGLDDVILFESDLILQLYSVD